MWLDRFSHHPSPSGTPPPQVRSYSPAPQRHPISSNLLPPRPGLTPRSSSLSRPNLSNPSLPSTARTSSLPGVKSQVNTASPANVPDPLKVLEHIIGAEPKQKGLGISDVHQAPLVRPKELVEDVDFGGLSLEAFANGGHNMSRRRSSSIRMETAQSIAEYNKEKDTFEDLHKSIAGCDEVLKNVETYLTGFRADLVTVSAEIETLQSRSTSLSGKLQNRKVVEKLLGPAVEDLSLSPVVVRKIADGPVDDGFISSVAELEKRSKAISAKIKAGGNIKAATDLQPLLENLTTKAIERIRDHFVAQIKALRSPSMNAQVLQQQSFLKYKDLYTFLSRHHRQLSEEICQAYVNTMRWYYSNNFSRYQKALEKLKIHVIDKNDTIALEDPIRRGGSLLSNASKGSGAPYDAFSLGRRLDILKNRNPNAITSYLAEEDKSTHYLETPFHAFNLALIDNASFEYTFLSTFFHPANSLQSVARTFASIFEPTFAIARTFTRSLVDSSADALGILLAVRINQHLAFKLQRRKVPTVDAYTNATNMLLWPRFQIVMDAHCEALRRTRDALSGRPQASSTLLAQSQSPSPSPSASSSASAQSTAPHPLTQRFANFLHALLALSSEAGDDEPVANSLLRLRTEFEAHLAKMSRAIPEQRKRGRFFFNNYSLVSTILDDGALQGKLARDVIRHFGERREEYGEES